MVILSMMKATGIASGFRSYLPAYRSALAGTYLLAASASAFAATPATLVADDPLAPLMTAYTQAVQPGEQIDSYRELFRTIFQRVQRSYPQEVDLRPLITAALKTMEPIAPGSGEPAVVFRTSINAALTELDPHSSYMDPRRESDSDNILSGGFGGLGIQVDMADGLVRIVSPMENTPASRAGLMTGDLIVSFDDQPVQGMTLADAISRMRGQPGTPITLQIRRVGRDTEFSVSLVRETIRTPALSSRMEDDVLVLRISSFTRSLGETVLKAVTDASATRTPRGIILDMRGNPGGLLNQAIVTADAFLNSGEIVSLHGRTAGNNRSWRADPAEQLAGVPMVVLIDGASASAAELVAAALQENKRAIVMGQRSYGKGSVQSIISLGNNKGSLRLTTALYYGPSGQTVQRAGVSPDIELVPSSALPIGRGGRREADLAHALPGTEGFAAPQARVAQERCAPAGSSGDQALGCALQFIRAGALGNFLAVVDTVKSAN